jgi:hypothetical protein
MQKLHVVPSWKMSNYIGITFRDLEALPNECMKINLSCIVINETITDSEMLRWKPYLLIQPLEVE